MIGLLLWNCYKFECFGLKMKLTLQSACDTICLECHRFFRVNLVVMAKITARFEKAKNEISSFDMLKKFS